MNSRTYSTCVSVFKSVILWFLIFTSDQRLLPHEHLFHGALSRAAGSA